MGHVMSDFPKIQLLAPKRGMPPKHFADLTAQERIDALAELGEVFLLRGLVAKREELLLERRRERNELVARVVLVDPLLDLGQPLVLLADVVALTEVDEVDDRLGGEEHHVVDHIDLSLVLSKECSAGQVRKEVYLIWTLFGALDELG